MTSHSLLLNPIVSALFALGKGVELGKVIKSDFLSKILSLEAISSYRIIGNVLVCG